MESTCDSECMCAVCHCLLTEDPEEDEGVGPSPAKRSKATSPAEGGGEGEPQPSTSATAGASQSYSGGGSEMPALCTPPCGHVFHKVCLDNWIKRKRECPSCRKKVFPKRLTKIYLPLTPGGQCRQCKVRVKEVECSQMDRALALSRADECKKNEESWRDRCVNLTQVNEDLNEQVIWKGQKIEDLEAQIEVDKTEEMRSKRCMEEREADFRLTIEELEKDVKVKEGKYLEKEKAAEALQSRCEELEKEKRKLEEVVENNKRNIKVNELAAVQGWRRLYKLALMEKEKFRKDRDYERERANLLEDLCRGNINGDQQLHECILFKTSISDNSRPSKRNATTVTINQNVNLAVDLEVSESEGEEEEQEEPPPPSGDNQDQQKLQRQMSSATVIISSDSEDEVDTQTRNNNVSIVKGGVSSTLSAPSSPGSSSSSSSDSEDDDSSGASTAEDSDGDEDNDVNLDVY